MHKSGADNSTVCRSFQFIFIFLANTLISLFSYKVILKIRNKV